MIVIELWSEEPTGLSTDTLGLKRGGRKTRSIVEGVPKCE